ncbi:uncharacterized protein LOC130052470 [Ostrea edulis]|uniref:uncharacterized protein LOC130052470 n=1 Tax=Ostrea edulis TaxID=37623 RepID=UPI0024AF8035|nr:uncharacterized protein LOC130052470 [Ostrea edulis]
MASSGGLNLITIFLIPLVTHINFAIALDCYRGSPCCILWNEDLNICSDCKGGYFGENCDSPCRYPSYGVDCQLGCFCNESYCNHKHGCRGNRDRPMEAQAESKQNTHATNRCKSTEDTKGRKVLVYLTVVLGMVGLLQLAVYIGLSVLYEPRVLTSKRPSQIAQKTRT